MQLYIVFVILFIFIFYLFYTVDSAAAAAIDDCLMRKVGVSFNVIVKLNSRKVRV